MGAPGTNRPGLPWPYAIALREIDKPSDTADQLRLLLDETPGGSPWSLELVGDIPAKLSAGVSEFNLGEHVTYAGGQNLHAGGMGARVAKSPDRYRYTAGIYAGDTDELYLQPLPQQIKGESISVPIWPSLPAGGVIKAIVPWYTRLGGAGGTPTRCVAVIQDVPGRQETQVSIVESVGGALTRTAIHPNRTGEMRFPGVTQEHGATIFQDRLVLANWNPYVQQNIFSISIQGDVFTTHEHATFYAHMVYGDGDRRLWFFVNNLAYWHANPFADTPTAWNGPIKIGSSQYAVRRAMVYGASREADSGLYVTKNDGVYRVLEGENGEPLTIAEQVLSFGSSYDENGRMLFEHQGEVYTNAGGEMVRHTLGNTEFSGPNADNGLPPSLETFLVDGVTTGRHAYLLARGAQRPGGQGYQQIIETRQGEAFHQVFVSDNFRAFFNSFDENTVHPAFQWNGRVMAAVHRGFTGNGESWLLFAGGQLGDQLWQIPIRNGSERLRQANGYLSRPHGLLELPPFFSQNEQLEKVWHWMEMPAWPTPLKDVQVRFYHNAHYSHGGESGWRQTGEVLKNGLVDTRIYSDPKIRMTDLGPNNGSDQPTLAGRYVAASGLGVRVEIVRTADADLSTETPVFKGLLFAYTESEQSLRRWTFNCDIGMKAKLADNTRVNLSTADIEAILDRLQLYATQRIPIVLLDPQGREAIVRIDLTPFMPTNWLYRKTNTGDKVYEPAGTMVRVVCTELYRRDSL